MLTIREFHGKDEEDNKIEEKIRNDIRELLTESNTINNEADIVADEIYRAIRYQKFDKFKVVKKEEQYFGYIDAAFSLLKEKIPIFGNDIFECLRETELYREIESMEKTMKSEEANNTMDKRRLNEIKRKTANMLAHYERFVYSRSFRSNPPRLPIDGI